MAKGFKTGGRQKGTPNKNTSAMRENFQTILIGEVDSGLLREMLHQLSPKDYVSAILKMCAFALPKPQAADYSEEPHAPTPDATGDAPETEEPQQEEVKYTGNLARNPIPFTITPEEIERFRIGMDWDEEQLERFLQGEPIERINSKQ